MAEDFGLKIALQGEREFKRAITEIDASFRVLGSEMKLVDAQFKRSDDAQAKYAAKGKVLAEQISAQKDKINTLETALKNAATNFGETDRRTLAWQTQLNNAKAALADLEGELEDNNKALETFGDNADEAGDDTKDAAKDTGRLETAVDDLGDEMDSSGKKTLSFGDVLKTNLASEAIVAGVKAIGSAIKAVGRGFVDAMKDGVQYNATMESYTASFTTMLGDEAKAHQLVADLKAKAASTPYGMQDLADATRTLMSFGISAQDAQKYMGMLGDVAQGDKEKFSSLSLAFAQVSSAGKLTGQDLMQMINAGFNPLEEINRKTGKSIGELKDEMSKGAISAEMVAEAFESATAEGGRFYGAIENQSKTFNGQQLMMVGVTLLTALIRNLPTIVSAIPQIVSGIVSAFGQGVSQMVSVGGNLVRGLWNGIQGLAGWLWNQVSSWVSSIWDGITSFFGIHSPSLKMAWAGEMLAKGLAAGIDENAERASNAANEMARDIDAAFSELTEGLDIPVDVKTQAQLASLDQVTSGLTTPTNPAAASAGLSAESVQSVVEAVVPSMLKGMDIRMVLDDGTLVGKLAPRIDTGLAGLTRRGPSLAIN